MPNNLYAVTYQVHKPDPNASDPIADLYRLAPVEAHVVAAAQDQATLSAVIMNNITLQPGEVFDILQCEQEPPSATSRCINKLWASKAHNRIVVLLRSRSPPMRFATT